VITYLLRTVEKNVVDNETFMYAKHGNLVDADTSALKPYKTPRIMFRGRSRSHIRGSLKSRRGTVYYCIIMWA